MVTEEAPGGSACLKHSKHSQSSKDLERSWKETKVGADMRWVLLGQMRFLVFRRILGDDEMYNYRCITWDAHFHTKLYLSWFEGFWGRWCTHLAPSKNRKDLRWVSSVFLVCCLRILPSSSGHVTKRVKQVGRVSLFWFQRTLHSLDNSTGLQDFIAHIESYCSLENICDWLTDCM